MSPKDDVKTTFVVVESECGEHLGLHALVHVAEHGLDGPELLQLVLLDWRRSMESKSEMVYIRPILIEGMK